ncbi:TlpA disulfide reductase family protein [Actinopolymorpha sp. B11F2]|uniref:TlpA family protein disulfide reductase n=1 Tax=Actinopolymorpha sp. B11F2 TaxID=3160862 RepID=UPI0032E4378E
MPARASALIAVALAAVLLLAAGCAGADVGGVGDRTAPEDRSGRSSGPATRQSLDSPDVVALRTDAGLASCDELTSAQADTPRAGPKDSSRAPLPDLTLPCLGPGGDVPLAEITGRPAVINVWAQWCGPCREESPHFQTLYEHADGQLTVMGVDYDDPQPARALAFVDQLGLRYPQAADPDKRLRAPFGLFAGLPATVFVDADGRIVHVAHRAYESERSLARDVRTHLGVELEMER